MLVCVYVYKVYRYGDIWGLITNSIGLESKKCHKNAGKWQRDRERGARARETETKKQQTKTKIFGSTTNV